MQFGNYIRFVLQDKQFPEEVSQVMQDLSHTKNKNS